MKGNRNTEIMHISIPPEIKQRLAEESKRIGVTMTAYTRMAILEKFERSA